MSAALLVMASMTLTACGSNSDDVAGKCTTENARAVAQAFITASTFDVDCVTVKAGVPFYFVNNDEATHTVTSEAPSPESFDAELPKKNSTYSHTFAKTGTYTIKCKRHSESMTLIVT